MARYIDADRIHPDVTWMPSANALFKSEIDRQPTADVVKVVRCKKCRHYDTEDCCEGFGWCTLHDRGLNDEGFCSEGKYKED